MRRGILTDNSHSKVAAAFLAVGVLLVSVLSGSAQQNARGGRVRSMNNQLLELHSQAQSDPGNGASLSGQATDLMQQRVGSAGRADRTGSCRSAPGRLSVRRTFRSGFLVPGSARTFGVSWTMGRTHRIRRWGQ